MESYNILTYPNTFLKTHAAAVQDIDGELQAIIDGMAASMYAAPGIGLAAVQVGINQQLIIYDIADRDENRELHVLINPKIVESDGLTVSKDEGCLSVPGFRANVNRAARVHVTGYDRHGSPVDMDVDGILAIVLQHEIDHLNGTLFIDRISSLKRQMYKRKVLKQLKK